MYFASRHRRHGRIQATTERESISHQKLGITIADTAETIAAFYSPAMIESPPVPSREEMLHIQPHAVGLSIKDDSHRSSSGSASIQSVVAQARLADTRIVVSRKKNSSRDLSRNQTAPASLPAAARRRTKQRRLTTAAAIIGGSVVIVCAAFGALRSHTRSPRMIGEQLPGATLFPAIDQNVLPVDDRAPSIAPPIPEAAPPAEGVERSIAPEATATPAPTAKVHSRKKHRTRSLSQRSTKAKTTGFLPKIQ
jgi:hypothetical protein